jgi:hypothetical protein
MRRLILLAVTAMAGAAFFTGPSTASASCGAYIEEIGCVNTAVCNATGAVLDKVPGKLGDNVDCIE